MSSVASIEFFRALMVVLLAVVLPASIWAGDSSSNSPLAGLNLDRYTVRHWTTSDGMPAGQIQALCQTKDGYLWVGTRHGLGRFDGTQFKVVTYLNCFSLAEDKDGILWAGTSSGLYQFRDGGFKPIALKPAPAQNEQHVIFGLCPRQGGGVWVCDVESLLSVRDGKTERFPETRPLGKTRCIYEDTHGRIWFAGRGSPYRWSLETRKIEICPQMPSMKGSDVTTVMEDSGQGIWFGGPFLEVFQLKDGEVRNFEKDRLYGGTPVVVMVEDSEKTLWAGSAAGLWQVGSNSLMRPQGLDGSAFGSIHCLITNQEGGIWLGTEGNGLFLLERRRFSSLGKDNGLANSDSWSISQAPDGSVWIGTKGGLSHLAKGRFENFGTLEGFESLNVHSVVVDSRGRVWAGTQVEHGTGWGALHRFQDKRFPSLETTIGFKSGDVHSLCPAQDGTLWIVASGAVSKWEGEKIRTLERRQVSGLSAFVDRKENLWIGLGGLTRLKGTDITYFGSKEGLSPSQYAAVHEDENGALWVLSSDKGIIRYKDGQFKSITTQHGLLSDLNLSLVEDDQGRYWFNCYNGIYWVRKQELNEVADGKRQAISCVAYGLEDGLPSLEGNGGNTPNGRKTRDGLLWFPTTKGVAIIDPSRTMRDDQPLSIIIEQVRADGEVMYKDVGEPEKQEVVRTSQQHSGRKWETTASLNSELRLSAGSGHSVVVNYAAPNFFTAEKTRYRFRLEGRDPKWMEAQSQHFAQLEGLQPGHYVFHVTACNRHGVWNPVGAQFAFYIPALFYQTWPFYTVCAGLLISAGTGIQAYRLSVQRRILGFERAAALAEERERIARDMHDDLGASLTRIAQLSERAKGETGDESRSSIDKISTAAGELVDSVGELVWATNSKYDDLESMVAYFREYTAQYSDGAGIECHIDFPEVVPSTSVSADFRRQLFLVLKEALHNVTKHAEAKDVWVRLEISGEQLRLEVRDNGKGMECKKSPAFHHGLSNMRERVQSLGGKFQIQSELGKGTVVGVEVPFPARMKEKGGAKKS